MVPLLIHLLNRRRYRDEPWAAMQFILSAVQRTRRRLRTEQWILLAVRTLIMALVGLVVARPYFAPPSALMAVGEQRVDRVLVVDDSLSMRAGTSMQSSALERAKLAMLKLMDRSGASGGFAVVTASRPASAGFDQPVQDRLAVRQFVDAIDGTWAASDLRGGLERADAILARSTAPPDAREIYVFSDFCERDWNHPAGAADVGLTPLANVSRVVLVRPAPESRCNRAITGLHIVGQPALLNGAAEVRVEVMNFSPVEMPATVLTLRVAEREVGRRNMEPLAPGARATVDFHVTLEPGAVHVLEAAIGRWEGDWLPEDDRRRLAVDVPGRRSVLLVESRTQGPPVGQSLFHFRLALGGVETLPAEGVPFSVTQVTLEEFRDVVLKDYDVVAIGDLSLLRAIDIERLQPFVSRGGGLIAFCENLEQSTANMVRTLLPVRLLDVHEAAVDEAPPNLTIADPNHVMLADFIGQARSILGRAHVTAWRRVQIETGGPRLDRIIATSTGDPILLLGEVGTGRIALWLTSADMAWTNFPAKPDYPPLMMNLTGYVAGDRNLGRNVLVGETLRGSTPVGASERMELTLPDGKRQRVERDQDEGGSCWKLTSTALPGVYEWVRGLTRDTYCVNPDIAESDLRQAERTRVAAAFGDRATFVDSSELTTFTGAADVRELGWLLAVILLLGATGESLLGRVFGGAR